MRFKEDLVKLTMPMGMGMQSDVLILKDKVVLLMDLMGNKLAMGTTKKEVENENTASKKAVVKLIAGETKNIAGYECKKAILSTPGEKDIIYGIRIRLSQMDPGIFKCLKLKASLLNFL